MGLLGRRTWNKILRDHDPDKGIISLWVETDLFGGKDITRLSLVDDMIIPWVIAYTLNVQSASRAIIHV